MFIDIHSHTPTHKEVVPESERRVSTKARPDRAVAVTFSWDNYHAATRDVKKAIVFGIRLKHGDTAEGGEDVGVPWKGDVNAQTAEFVKTDPEKLTGFMSVHPEHDDVLEDMEYCVNTLGLRGIKLGPNYQQYDPLGEAAFRMFEAAEGMGLPIVFHQGTSPMRLAPLRWAHPLVMDEIAMAFPELRVVMAHMGHPWTSDTYTVIRKHPHVYADISAAFYRPWSFYNSLMTASEWGVMDKLLFGTDFPIATAAETAHGLLNVNHLVAGTDLPRVPEKDLQAIIDRDGFEALGLND